MNWLARLIRPRFSLRVLLLMIGFAAAFLAILTSLWREQPSPRFGLLLVFACVGVMVLVLVAGAIRRDRASGIPRSPVQVVSLVLGSIALAASIVLLSDLAFLITHRFFHDFHPLRADERRPVIHATGLVAGIVMALMVASRLREAFWLHLDTTRSDRQRRWARLWPIALVAILAASMGFEDMRERYSFGRMMADYHADHVRDATDPKSAALHERLRHGYERNIWRPWLPIHPDEAP